jgi:hypothetical protein
MMNSQQNDSEWLVGDSDGTQVPLTSVGSCRACDVLAIDGVSSPIPGTVIRAPVGAITTKSMVLDTGWPK